MDEYTVESIGRRNIVGNEVSFWIFIKNIFIFSLSNKI